MVPDNYKRAMNQIGFVLILAIFMGSSFFFLNKLTTSANENIKVIAEHEVLKLEFIENKNLFSMATAYVETADDILTITVRLAEFVPVSDNDTITLKEFTDRKPGEAEHVFYIPEDQLIDIKRDYAQTYGSELTITELTNTTKE